MHRLRREVAVLSSPAPLRQAWVPRVLNLALAGFFLLFLVPIATHLAGRTATAQVLLVLLALPFLLLTVLCLCSAVRPGALGRAARRARAARSRTAPPPP